jgi:hypothetical protein
MAVEDARVVDQDVDLAERRDERRDAGEVLEIVADAAGDRLPVQPVDPEAGLLEQAGGRGADALRRAGDEDRLQSFRPGMVKPAALSSVISSCSCF